MPNRLITSQSLYLRKHAENPVDWWPWGSAALEKAVVEDRPIFLSIGYSSCHWCTVMEGEAFSNRAIAEFMNAHFLPIKVDREEQPDLDSIYMQSLQLMTGQGGWPLNVFLTPEDRVPFYAGTYFPVEPRYGRPGFLEVLQRIWQFYSREKDKIALHKEQLLGALSTLSQLTPETRIPAQLLAEGLRKILPLVSSLRMGQQFPMMPYAQTVLRVSRLAGSLNLPETEESPLERAQQRGMDLVLGGIFDHVGGGFHRYTVDATWTVPHFEKMLYDNGQIVEFLAELWAQGIQEPALQRAVRLTIGWLQREMTARAGYFYAAQDADSFASAEDPEPEEGEFYIWRWQELQNALTTDGFQALQKAFDLSVEGNFGDRPGTLVLQRQAEGSLDPLVEEALTLHLFAHRYGEAPLDYFPPAPDATVAKQTAWGGRIPPVTDTKMIVAWNSLMISGLVRAFQVFGDPSTLRLAIRAAQFIGQQQRPAGSLQRLNYDGFATVAAKSEDYALLIKAWLDLHQATLPLLGDPGADYWLSQAVMLQAEMDERLWDPEQGGYFVADADSSQQLLVREKEFQDNATPAANGIAIANLVRLSAITGDLSYLDRAEQGLKTFGQTMMAQPRSCPSLFMALDWYQHFLKVTVKPEYVAELQAKSWPTTVFVLPQPGDNLPEDAVGMVCVGLKCLAPAISLDQLISQMRQGEVRISPIK